MWLLVTGIALFMAIHFVPSIARSLRTQLVEKLGSGPYRGLFSLAALIALALIIFGWRQAPSVPLYHLPLWVNSVSGVLMLLAFVLFTASFRPTRLKRVIRHPQLTAVLIWSAAHLLANGETRSVVLFGGIGIWALAEKMLINMREGSWLKPQAEASATTELGGLALSIGLFAAVLWLHPFFAGVRPLFW